MNDLFFCGNLIKLQITNPILVDLVARRLQEIRERHKHTKEYVLHETGLGISAYENKIQFPTLESIAKFCKLYNMSLEEFFEGITYPKE